MFLGCELYLYDGLLLNEELCKKLKIVMTTKFELMALLDNYRVVVKLNNQGIIHAESLAIKEEIVNNSIQNTYFYIKRGDYIIIPNIEIYYGICNNNEVIAVYKDRQVRDAKLYSVNVAGFYAIFDDIKENGDTVQNINLQLKLNKSYKQLQYYSKNDLN